MDNPPTAIKRVVVLSHPKVPQAQEEAARIAASLTERGVQASHGLIYDENLNRQIQDHRFDLMVALGGDGTLLRAGHLAGPYDLPILGINLGRFGFLAEIHGNHWHKILPRLLEGDYRLERRMTLCIEHIRDEKRLGSWDVLNEVVVTRGQYIRPIHLVTEVDGRHLTTYVADALIASTPTGSTAYALAAGGPILPPELRNILLVPVAPHLSLERAIVLAEGSWVGIEVRTDHEAVFSVDGQAAIPMNDGDRVTARAGKHIVKFIRFQDPGYFYRNLTPHMNQNPSVGHIR
jgi:NAD+ kinase